MPYDAFTYSFLTRELNDLLSNGKIDKITMPEKDEVFILVRARGVNHLLNLSCGAQPAVFITQKARPNVPVPPAFCMHLRKHIGGGIIESVTKEPDERIIYFNIACRNELGIEGKKSLVCEIMGKYSNLILVNENGVISDAIKRIPFDEKIKRQILPGLKYTVLPQDKLSPLDFEGIKGLKFAAHPLDLLQKCLKGVAPVTVAEAVFNAEQNSEYLALTSNCGDDIPLPAKEILCDELGKLFTLPPSPCVVTTEKGADFFVRPYNCVTGKNVPFDSLNAAVDFCYFSKEHVSSHSAKAKNLATIVKNAKKRAEKRLAEYATRLNAGADLSADKLYGELITANIYKIKAGDTTLTAQNYYSEDYEEVVIALDPTLPPAANAQVYYKKYAKKKRTLEMTETQKQKTEEELAVFASLLYEIERAESAEELADIAEEMLLCGLVKTAKREKGMRPSKPFCVEKDGHRIYAGKNNLQNEALIKSAAKNDIWLHVRGVHGAHVVIECQNRPVSDEILVFAAVLCAQKSGLSGKTEVDYTLIRHVSKPAGAAPGRVVYTHQKTLFVDV